MSGATPAHRYNPHFNDLPLASALKRVGVDYRHAPELGGMRDAPGGASLNDGWEPGAFRNYADYALTAEFQDALAALQAKARSAPVAIMCAEKDWRQCHRQIISDYLLSRGEEVRHLISTDTDETASLDLRAQRADGGLLHYRAPPSAQFDLFQ